MGWPSDDSPSRQRLGLRAPYLPLFPCPRTSLKSRFERLQMLKGLRGRRGNSSAVLEALERALKRPRPNLV